MKTLSDRLQDHAAAQAQKIRETETAKLAEFRDRMTPTLTRLRRFIATVPESERRPQSITFFSEAIKPRWRGRHAAQRDVADALRKLGFTRKRGWVASEGGFRSVWYWPESSPAQSADTATGGR